MKMRSTRGGDTPTVAHKDPRRRPAVAHHRGVPARPPRHPWSPDPSDISEVRRWVSTRSGPTAIDIFAGAGGLSLGLHQAGFDVLVGADSDEWAMETHGANLPGLTWAGDLADPTDFLQTLDVWGVRSVDLVAGGVPCQPFSRAGRPRIRQLVESGERAAHDARADLWESFVAVVERLGPRAVLVENVPDLPRWDDGAVLIGFYESLRSLGYTVEARILDGFRYGVPQHRQRLVLIGLAEGRQPVWPKPTDSFVSLRDAIGDLPVIPRAQRTEELPYDPTRISSAFQEEMRAALVGDAADLVWDHICRDVRPDDMEAFALLGQGQTYIDLPERLRRYRSDVFTDKYKRLTWSGLSRSITAHIAKDGYWYIHPEQHRTLSVREAARIQTFPDHVRFAGTQTHRYRQIGNAVPVSLARAVGEAIVAAMDGPAGVAPAKDQFRRRLLDWSSRRQTRSPWRHGDDPWIVLAGELCLRRVSPSIARAAYGRLVRLAPVPAALVKDPDVSVAALREIGLKGSAEVLVAVAGELVGRFGGTVPEDVMELRSLHGVGDHVCRAVLCFGFGRRAVLLDGSTSRVCTRINDRDHAHRFQLCLDLHRLAGSVGPDAEFNRALLDLGETTCHASSPLCGACPVSGMCSMGRPRRPEGGQVPDDDPLALGAFACEAIKETSPDPGGEVLA